MGMLNIDEHVEEHRVLAIRYPDKAVMLGQTIPFPGFVPRLLASLVASSTAACTSGVVTVTAAGHLLPAINVNGFSFYYPGSDSLSAGWYSDFYRASVDTVTFSAPLSADFTSESVNAGAEFTSEVTHESIVIPANTLSVGDRVSIPVFRVSNNTAGTKTTRLEIDSNAVSTHANTSTTVLVGPSDFSFTVISPNTAFGHGNTNGSLTTTLTKATLDIGASLTVSLTNQLSAAGMYLATISPKLRIE